MTGPEVSSRADDPRWARPALVVLLAVTAGLYLWDLSASGWANAYYSAAVQAGATSWKAFFFGSFDAANFITVDKAPAFLWPMEIAARIFGVSSWSILVPQALEGVGAVWVLYLAVRRWFGAAAGLVAGAVLALTPVAALMFRYNNPDALLTLVMTAAAYAMVRAVEAGSTRWVVLAGSLAGWAFLAKMLQGMLVVPALGLVYLVAAPVSLGRRVRRLFLAGLAMVASAGWWVAIVELWPKSSRPYIGGSQTDSVLELVFGYNGFGRLTGNETGSVGGGPPGSGGRWGATGMDRLFNAEYGGQISWLLPAALLLLVALVAVSWRAPRTDRTRAAALLWGGWLVVTGLAISLGEGIIHSYYTIALAPAIGALVGIGSAVLWRRRHDVAARLTLAAVAAVTAWWSHTLLGRTPDWHPELRNLVLVAGAAAAIALALPARPRVGALVAAGALAAALAGPTAYTWATVHSPGRGALPLAGPAVAGRFGPGRGPGGAGNPAALRPGDGQGRAALPVGGAGGPAVGGGQPFSGPPGGNTSGRGAPGGGTSPPGAPGPRDDGNSLPFGFGNPGGGTPGGGAAGPGAPGPRDDGNALPFGFGNPGGGRPGGPAFPGNPGRPGNPPFLGGPGAPAAPGDGGRRYGGPPGGRGGILDSREPSAELAGTIADGAGSYTWAAATVSAMQAAGYQLATGEPVMAIGGFNGTDPAPTLEEFEALVADGAVHWFIDGGGGPGLGGPPGARDGAGRGPGGAPNGFGTPNGFRPNPSGPNGFGGGPPGLGPRGTANEIAQWVRDNFEGTTIDGVTIYDLSGNTTSV